MRINRRLLHRAMHSGGRIDAAHAILGYRGAANTYLLPGQIPPFLLAGFQQQTLPQPNPPQPSQALLSLRDFERLSLGARASLFPDDLANNLDQSLDIIGVAIDKMPVVHVADIEAALAWAAHALAPGSLETAPPLTLSSGLQIVGCKIISKDKRPLNLKNTQLPFSLSFIGCIFDEPIIAENCSLKSLDLSGSGLPGLQANDLRTEGGVCLRRSTILSPIDLSGARIGGSVDGCDMLAFPARAQGSYQKIDHKHGMLNLNQTVIESELNLSRARLWGGLSLRGTTVNEQVTLTGAILASPLAMIEKWIHQILIDVCNTEDLRPIKDIESLGEANVSLAENVLHLRDRPKKNSCLSGEQSAVNSAVPNEPNPYFDALIKLELLTGVFRWDDTTLTQLLSGSFRTRANALSADALYVGGTFDASYVYASGGLRMRYAKIKGAVRFDGSTLNSADASRSELKRIIDLGVKSLKEGSIQLKYVKHLESIRKFTGEAFNMAINDDFHYPQDYSVDLRNSTMANIEFGRVDRVEPALLDAKKKGPLDEKPLWTRLNGRLALSGAKVEGSIIARDLLSLWLPDSLADMGLNWKYSEPGFCKHDLLDKQKNWKDGLKTSPDSNNRDKASARSSNSDWDQPSILLSQASVGDDVDLSGSIGVWGVDFRDAAVGGRILFTRKNRNIDEQQATFRQGRVPIEFRAKKLGGVINLRGTAIEGDALLIFDPNRGPDITADLAQIKGRLAIYPSVGARHFGRKEKPEPEEKPGDDENDAYFWWQDCEHRFPLDGSNENENRCECCNAIEAKSFPRLQWTKAKISLRYRFCQIADYFTKTKTSTPFETKPQKHWFIDLRNAKATVFCHPPAAWAHPEATSLDGFRYERSSFLGPLPPIGNVPATGKEEPIRSKKLRRFVACGLGCAILLASIVYCFHRGMFHQPGMVEFHWPTVDDVNLWIMWLAAFLLPVWGFAFMYGGKKRRPMALEYLSRHRTDSNRVQNESFPSRFIPLDPYVVAAKALRDAGRTMSAEEVDYYRLKQLAHALSFRRQGPLKIVMLIFDGVTGYGYRSSRLVAATLIAVLIVGLGGQEMARQHLLLETDQGCLTTKGSTCPAIGQARRGPSLFEVVSLFNPAGEADWPWTPAPCIDEPILGWLEAAPKFLKALGLFITVAFGTSILTRFQVILGRKSE